MINQICAISTCDSKRYKRQWCNAHYLRWRRHGSPLAGSRSHESHGMHKTPTYISWLSIKQRCYNKENKKYRLYGGKGITVYERWRNSFASFYADMGIRPPGTTLDRVNGDLGYYKENCRWATPTQQANNTNRNRHYTINGVTKNLGQWIIVYNLNENTVRARIRLGWSIEESLNLIPRRELPWPQ